VESAEVAIGILAFAILLEAWSFRTAIVESNKVRGDVSWWQFVRRSKNPELPVVLLEDLGAMVGLVIALGAVIVTVATDDPLYDAIGTLSIGVLLTMIAIMLAIEMKSLLIGESADAKVQESIRSAIEIEPAVEHLIHMRTQHLGPEELIVGAKVSFLGNLTVPELAAAVNRVEDSVRRAVPSARIMYIEPDVMATSIPAGSVAPQDVVGALPPDPAEKPPAHLAKARPVDEPDDAAP
jgi:divalent metal cation (Fe/Co/Zn/Cd) transporter